MGNYFTKTVLAVSVLLLCGCQAATGYYRGALARPKTVAPLPAATGGYQHWQDLYAEVDYNLRQDGDRQVVEGVFKFADYPRGMMVRVKNFEFKLFWLDDNKRVLDYLDLLWVTGPRLETETEFSRMVTPPEGATAVSFGYEGKFADEEGFIQRVWLLPLKSAE